MRKEFELKRSHSVQVRKMKKRYRGILEKNVNILYAKRKGMTVIEITIKAEFENNQHIKMRK